MNHEVRLDEDGTLDEVVAERPQFVHLERMSDESVWIGITTADGTVVHVNVVSPKGPLSMSSWTEGPTPPQARGGGARRP